MADEDAGATPDDAVVVEQEQEDEDASPPESEVRQRKSGGGSGSGGGKEGWREREQRRRVERAAGPPRAEPRGNAASDFVHRNFDKILSATFWAERAGEQLANAVVAADAAYESFMDRYGHHDPHAIGGMVLGLILCFFGEQFATSLALYEAFMHGGGHTIYQALSDLYRQFKGLETAEETEERAEREEARRGKHPITPDEVANRKLVVAMKSVDPKTVTKATSAIWTALLACVAAVETEFARTLSLGVSIGTALNRPAQRFVVPVLRSLAPPFAYDWIPDGVAQTCRFAGAVLTYLLLSESIVGAIYAGVKGGHLLLDSFLEFCDSHGLQYLEKDRHMDELAAWAVVALGVAFQLFVLDPDDDLPFVLDIVLAPFLAVEHAVDAVVGFMSD